ncbi:tRNA pseudouridine synthase B [Lacunisphaera limnophila]|uniref:tRNA pseudouridine synthase B n=1 Tax=Lacunisphaera limnophila TaxID=1838286 RepID=A0A1I7PHA6_9BACT|nr:tRNA pseudouridine(55) synthase TruB [Lacunisphaera limnophila]AOS42980.1 tRNA pseudouridine synthase B [Lacunisphaera limnophila]
MSLGPTKEMEGVLLVDKPKGLTSHDVVYRLRRKLGMKKIGHAGTLDPMATGVLVMLIGKATRISQYLMSVDKAYEGEATLGVVTDSQDAEGEMMETRPVPELTVAQVREVMKTFMGDQYQTPPMHSAIKIDGVPLYKLARKGEEVEREPRFIRVTAFDLLTFDLPKLTFDLHCTKGTYVRTIAHDLGNKLGCGAHLSALRRTASGQFTIKQCLPLEEIETMALPDIEKRLIPIYEAAPRVAL